MSEAARRLRRLEAERGRSKPCPECGSTPGDPQNIEYRVEFEDPHTEDEIRQLTDWYNRGMPIEEMPAKYREPSGATQKRCPKCGKVRETVINWDDAHTGRELAEMEAKFFTERPWEKYEEEFEAEQAEQSEVPDYPPDSWDEGTYEGGGYR